uniref:Minor capsid protein L2 n=1 Tax=Alphapapillomavirus 9 TaxID=337041 RepID=A0A166MBC0_9PAPI|nr:L2 [Human papillomavirus 16]
MRHKRSAKRTKRASATQLYKTCKQAGTCPPDIIPKVEGKTIADQILQYGSMGVFFGGLGIGTGSGTGGRTGYIPLGTRPPTATDTLAPVRPPLTVDPVGPSDPSIVSLVEETSFIDAGAPTSVPSIPPDVSGFSITTSTDTTPAILDINNTVTTVTTHNNPTFTDPSVLQPPTPAETGGHFTLSSSTISTHNYEEIPMDTFIVSTNPNTVTSSTPIPGSRPVARLGLYSRTTQQVKVVDPAFITTPTKLITYNNPAYEGIDVDNTLYFSSNDNSINIAPDPDFLDIVALHRPALTSRRTGIRYSRIGNKQTLRTRSGKSIGAKVHYYYDFSTIDPAEEIELQTITPSTYTTTSHAASPTSINNGLYDIYADDFITDTSTTPVPSVPSTSLSGYIPANTTIPFGGAYNIPLVSGPDIPINITDQAPSLIPIVPGSPQYTIIADAGDFYLHPSYYMLRKRRKRLPYFFSDVSLAA